MRLLNTKKRTFEEFIGKSVPPYAIVSHRWGDKEVSYQDFLQRRKAFVKGQCKGYGWTKIAQACEIARRDNIEWVWIDTCCIDKKSSAELSEAINSMFAWYERSEVCYVFLPDVDGESHNDCQKCNDGPSGVYPDSGYNESSSFDTSMGTSDEDWERERFAGFCPHQFRNSNWFTRAWTLQELLAPGKQRFYNSQFRCVGGRAQMKDFISETTGIPHSYLLKEKELDDASVALRMTWASKRTATREEDVAYSLLGIFEVNMPLLYGEGKRAFFRLQNEIIKNSDDETIFAWEHSFDYEWGESLLASAPGFFAGIAHRALFGNVLLHRHSRSQDIDVDYVVPRHHYELTNKGVRFNLPMPNPVLSRIHERESVDAVLRLNCRHDESAKAKGGLDDFVGIKITLIIDGGRSYHSSSYIGFLEAERASSQLIIGNTKSDFPFYEVDPLNGCKQVVVCHERKNDTEEILPVIGTMDDDSVTLPVYFPLIENL